MLTVGRTVLVLALAIPLGLAFDLTGVAAGYAIGFLADVALRSVIAARYLHQPLHALWSRREMAAVVAAYALGFLAARLVDDALGGHLGTLVALTAGSLAFAAAFVVGGGINRRDRNRLQEMLARRRAREPDPALAG
jgi:O-antigen/teichoic acid export membrane protein